MSDNVMLLFISSASFAILSYVGVHLYDPENECEYSSKDLFTLLAF